MVFKFQGTNEKFSKLFFFSSHRKIFRGIETLNWNPSSVQYFGDLSSPKLDFLIKTREKLKDMMKRE